MTINNYLLNVAIVFFVSLFVFACDSDTQAVDEGTTQTEEPTTEDIIAHGKYLVGIMGCNDCHSPKRMGEKGPEIIPELLLSGYPSDRPLVKFDSPLIKEGFAMFYPDLTAGAGPWGVSFAANLTPDDTGIGNWTEAQFKKALTEGKLKGLDDSRMMLPPMPWMNYIEMKDEDIHAVFSYLMSVDPVKNVVPQPISPDEM